MNGAYPPGCSQIDHDRAFGELGPDPDEDAAYDESLDDEEEQYQ